MACKNCEHFKKQRGGQYGWNVHIKCCVKIFDGFEEINLDDNCQAVEYFIPKDDFECVFDTSKLRPVSRYICPKCGSNHVYNLPTSPLFLIEAGTIGLGCSNCGKEWRK